MFFFSRKFLILGLVLLIPTFLGLFVRYKPVKVWKENPQYFYAEGRPIFTAYDSYYFARLADDYNKGIFVPGGNDTLRFVPDYGKYPKVIPLPSWLFAKLSAFLNKPVENIAFWLIPILAVLVVFPLVAFFYRIGLPLAGYGGALVISISLIYLVRTSLNRLDTDSLIEFSLFAIPTAVLFAYTTNSRRNRYLYILLAGLLSHIFYWWYLHPGLNLALFIFASLFVVSLYFDYKNWKKSLKQVPWKDIGLLALAFNPVILLEGVWGLLERLTKYIFQFGKPIEGNFPNVQISISELQKLSLKTISVQTVGNEFLFILGLVGAVFFILYRFRYALLLLPVFLMGLIAFKGASRFAMFLAPFIGIGLGFLFDLLWKYLKTYISEIWEGVYKLSVIGLLLVIVIFSNTFAFKFIPQPIMSPAVAEAFIEIGSCLLYTSPSPRDRQKSRMPSSA
jgi:asparagine N-glycosylation enzyme membrane subunit Stt3